MSNKAARYQGPKPVDRRVHQKSGAVKGKKLVYGYLGLATIKEDDHRNC